MTGFEGFPKVIMGKYQYKLLKKKKKKAVPFSNFTVYNNI